MRKSCQDVLFVLSIETAREKSVQEFDRIRVELDLPLLHSTVCLDVHDITDPINPPVSYLSVYSNEAKIPSASRNSNILVLTEVGGQSNHALLAEIAREGILLSHENRQHFDVQANRPISSSHFKRIRSVRMNVRECLHGDQRRDPL